MFEILYIKNDIVFGVSLLQFQSPPSSSNEHKQFLLHEFLGEGQRISRKLISKVRTNVRQKQPPELFCKNAVLKNFAILIRKYLCWSLFLFQHICFPVNIARFLRMLILKYICERLFLVRGVKHFATHLKFIKQNLAIWRELCILTSLPYFHFKMKIFFIFGSCFLRHIVFFRGLLWDSSRVFNIILMASLNHYWKMGLVFMIVGTCFRQRRPKSYKYSNTKNYRHSTNGALITKLSINFGENLGVTDLRSETKGSRFESGCDL